MNENTKDINKILKSQDNKSNLTIPKTNLFILKKLNISDKDSQQTKKTYIKFISFKKPYFKVNNSELYKKKYLHNPNIKDGRWTEEEKNRFIQGIVLYGINWKKVKTLIPSRSAVQVRSHAQKFYQRMKLCKEQNLGIDFTSKSIKNIKDMINQIKSKNQNNNIASILNKLSHGCINRRFIKKLKNIKKNINEINNNISENGDKNEFIKLDENNNYINKNFTLDQNNMNLFDNNNNCNNNVNPNNNIQFKNINIIDNNIINNKNIIPPNILTNSLNLNLPNDILSNNYLDKFNKNLINDDYLKKTFKNDSYINYLSLLNDLLERRIDLLNTINNYIDSVYLLNSLQNFNFLIKNSLINNTLSNNNNLFINNTNSLININNNLINNNNPIINNNNLIISNNIPIINNNIPMINNNKPLISNNIPIINNDNTLINNNNPIIDKNIPIINNNNSLIDNNIPLINNNNPIIDNYSPQIEKNMPLIKNQLTNNKDKENYKDNIVIEINEKQNL